MNNADSEPMVYTVNPNNNSFIMILSPGQYEINVEADGFENYIEKISVLDKDAWQAEMEKYFVLKPK